MPFHLDATVDEIAAAVGAFKANYHNDFQTMQPLKRLYLSDGMMGSGHHDEMAKTLSRILTTWGAGRRKAPDLREHKDIVAALREPRLRALLRTLARFSIETLRAEKGERRSTSPTLKPDQFDAALFRALHGVAQKFFKDCTNVTYPMKVLLLLTGQMPAFDSQVRQGLARAGLRGFRKTRYLLPATPRSRASVKIFGLPFELGNVWAARAQDIDAALRSAGRSELIKEPGRVFDVLLFCQGRPDAPILLKWTSERV